MTGRLSPFIEMGVGLSARAQRARQRLPQRGDPRAVARGDPRAAARDLRLRRARGVRGLKLKNFSSGMTVRLAFSMAIQVEADVVLVDEVLAVGDAGFQRKCYAQFDRLRSEGRTVLFVTHDMDALKRHCDRVLLLEEGRVADVGDPDGSPGATRRSTSARSTPSAPARRRRPRGPGPQPPVRASGLRRRRASRRSTGPPRSGAACGASSRSPAPSPGRTCRCTTRTRCSATVVDPAAADTVRGPLPRVRATPPTSAGG